jgi:aminoglycoside 6'-N-acetyltransferase
MATPQPSALHGRAVRLRPVTTHDAARLTEILTHPEVARWWGRFDLDRVHRELVDPDDGTVIFAIEADGQVIGLIQYLEENEPDYRHAAIDLFLDPDWHGRGLGADAIRTLARHLFQQRGHHRLTIDPAADNQRAIRAYRRVGFRPVGVMRRYERGPDGRWHDGRLMDLLPEDLAPAGPAEQDGPMVRQEPSAASATRVAIVDYDPTWPDQFQQLAATLRRHLDDEALAVDHIGSTSVPGLAAKDTIDIQVTVPALADADRLAPAFQRAGYVATPNRLDHRPAGDPSDPARWEKRLWRSPPAARRVNVHVRVAGWPNQRYALLFRDDLRAHPRVAAAYAQLKRALAERHGDDLAAYTELKDSACDLIIAAAEAWAANHRRDRHDPRAAGIDRAPGRAPDDGLEGKGTWRTGR